MDGSAASVAFLQTKNLGVVGCRDLGMKTISNGPKRYRLFNGRLRNYLIYELIYLFINEYNTILIDI